MDTKHMWFAGVFLVVIVALLIWVTWGLPKKVEPFNTDVLPDITFSDPANTNTVSISHNPAALKCEIARTMKAGGTTMYGLLDKSTNGKPSIYIPHMGRIDFNITNNKVISSLVLNLSPAAAKSMNMKNIITFTVA